ncbi:MAG: hypothetical protein RIQ96_641 [Pseudomonadota bacterium]
MNHPLKTLLASAALALACATPGQAAAATRDEIDAGVREALGHLKEHSSAGYELSQKAAGVLVFPTVVKAGLGVGGEYGEGALLVKGAPVAYYNVASASVGLQAGAQTRSQMLLFMNEKVLDTFRKSRDWKAGIDGSVAVANVGAGGSLDTKTVQQPIIGFIFSNKGLMANLNFEGTKITQIER